MRTQNFDKKKNIIYLQTNVKKKINQKTKRAVKYFKFNRVQCSLYIKQNEKRKKPNLS